MQKLALVLPKALPANIELISINVVIRNNWKNIVARNLYQFITFEKAVFTKFKELKVIVNILSAAIILVKSSKKSILSAIKLLTGIDNVTLCCKHTVL